MKAHEDQPRRQLPTLVFFRRERCGLSRRMESLVAWVKVTEKRDLRVVDVDAERSPALVERLRVRMIPSLVVIKDRRIVGRLEGRATGQQIDALIRPHLG
ncbi:MAG: thioredoxin family protein [Gaiellaceae bacterium]